MPLPLASDERRGQVASDRRRVADHIEQAIGIDRSSLSLQLERLERLGVDGVADERQRLGSDEDLSVRGRLLEAGGDVDGVAGHERLALSAHDDLAGVDPDPGLQLVRGDRLTHLGGGADGPQSVVLVRDRNPEDGHDRVADELLDGAAVTLDDRAEILEVAAHARAQRLRIGGLPERSRADEVAEEDRDDLALLAHARSLGGLYERTGWSSASSISGESVVASSGSKRPAPTSRTEAAPAATASRTA